MAWLNYGGFTETNDLYTMLQNRHYRLRSQRALVNHGKRIGQSAEWLAEQVAIEVDIQADIDAIVAEINRRADATWQARREREEDAKRRPNQG